MHVTEVRHPADRLPSVPQAQLRVFIGPVNAAGQGGRWSEALRFSFPDTTAVSYRYDLASGLAAAHLHVDPIEVRDRPQWRDRLRKYVTTEFTHVLIESNTALWRTLRGVTDSAAVIRGLRAAGLSVAMVAHGSDVKIPSLYRRLRPETQYDDMDPEFVERLERASVANVEAFSRFAASGGATFVTGPALLHVVPSARWLPVVVDVDRWRTDTPAFERRVPVVVHSPSSDQKGSRWIDPAMAALHAEGVIEYRRLESVPHDQMPAVVADADIVVEQICASSYGVTACEAMAAGRVVVGTADPMVRRRIAALTGLEPPIVRAGHETIGAVVRALAQDPDRAREIAAAGPPYVRALHDGRYSADVLRTWIAPESEPASDVRPPTIPPVPDCTVIVAVHNTVDYLPETLESLERQTLGLDALQIILVDDGSTDGSERIVDVFGERHGDRVVVVHQAASGTPASPFNRGLERATGRYVFFLGSDDVLDEDALETLVNHADVWNSDVAFGRLEPIGDRKVPIAIYADGRQRDMDLYSSRLPYNLSNTKLYRRELIERLGLRYREDMRQRCDQPFTITAMVHARRISMIGDGAVYHARERADRSNVTYTADAAEMYASTEIIMETIADQIEPGARRDHVMKRMFDNTIRGDLRDSLAHRDDAERAFVFDRIADLSARFLTDGINERMKVLDRAVIAAALDRDADRALALLRQAAEPDEPVGLHVEGERAWFAYPGFDPEGDRRPYEITRERPTKRISRVLSPARVRLDGGLIVVAGTAALTGSPRFEGRLVRAKTPSRTVRTEEPPQRGRRIDASVDPRTGDYRLTIAPQDLAARVFRPSLALRAAGLWYDIPLRFESPARPLRTGRLRRRQLAVARPDDAGHLVIDLR